MATQKDRLAALFEQTNKASTSAFDSSTMPNPVQVTPDSVTGLESGEQILSATNQARCSSSEPEVVCESELTDELARCFYTFPVAAS